MPGRKRVYLVRGWRNVLRSSEQSLSTDYKRQQRYDNVVVSSRQCSETEPPAATTKDRSDEPLSRSEVVVAALLMTSNRVSLTTCCRLYTTALCRPTR